MQKTAFIWDLDGTLLDSYEAILSGIEETYAQFSIPYDKEKVREFILKYSVQDLLVQVAEERDLDVEVLNHAPDLLQRTESFHLTGLQHQHTIGQMLDLIHIIVIIIVIII